MLLGGVPGVRPARVVIIGGGVVGTHAGRMAVGLGADTVIIERSLERLRQLDELFQGRVRTVFSSMESIETEAAEADVVIGAVLIPGVTSPTPIRKELLRSMKPGAVLVDVAIDQGGCFETSRPTARANPTFEVDGIIHYCVANMPGAAPATSRYALNNATLPFGIALADNGLAAQDMDPHLRNGLNVMHGNIVHPAVSAALHKQRARTYETAGRFGQKAQALRFRAPGARRLSQRHRFFCARNEASAGRD
ncbi:alanine dehydrogenase [Bradyrhizobium sp. LA6.4]